MYAVCSFKTVGRFTVRKNQQPTCHLDFCVFEETGDLLAVLFPHVRRSLEVAQIEAPDIIVMLEAEVGSTKAPNVDHMLLRTLRRMPLSALLDLIMAKDGFRPFLEEQVEMLRCHLG